MQAGMDLSTTSDFYNSFSLGGTTDYSLNDTVIDSRIGRRYNFRSQYNNGLRYPSRIPGWSAI